MTGIVTIIDLFIYCSGLFSQILLYALSLNYCAIWTSHQYELAIILPVLVKVLRSWDSKVTSFNHACVGVSTETRIEVSVPVVVDELPWAKVALVLRLGEQVLDESIQAFRWKIVLLAIWTVTLLLKVLLHALVAEEIVARWALLCVLHHIRAELAYQEVDERLLRYWLTLCNVDTFIYLNFLRLWFRSNLKCDLLLYHFF